MDEVIGSWDTEFAEKLKHYIREGRKKGSRDFTNKHDEGETQ